MPDPYSRRSFLTGVLASGTATAGTIYLLPGGRPAPASKPPPDTRLRLATGQDPSGARTLLIDMWNRANPKTPISLIETPGGSRDERQVMRDLAAAGTVDIVNLDVIHIPEFAKKGLIAPIKLVNPGEIFEEIKFVNRVPDATDQYWAAPLNTDAGMLFDRQPEDDDALEGVSLSGTLAAVPEGSRQFVGQLNPVQSTSYEAFVVNVLEHALSADPTILNPNGTVSRDLGQWQEALAPLAIAIRQGKVLLSGNESESRQAFKGRRYMRNWPVQYRELQKQDDVDAKASRIRVSPLKAGILGGQSIALVARSPHPEVAKQFIDFMTDMPAQKILASYGLAPARFDVYDDVDFKVLAPHLDQLRTAVENTRPRPMNSNYSQFSDAVRVHTRALLIDRKPLTSEFIDQIQAALG
ncbi:extracellular solute-binding protein [Plantactinospora soyae]|uniref:Multiple sugar transport system substrate-binding protein n=1 Tax=Plantactinospora soyae TaxID=1544732 RepID=A0A927MGZ6_9ACTN|nr:extracellular solute-binding protein [Plantactinospora soyae]MBE1491528.1 multiple sugar transport system substrate-binding protein [Plantactinospora soyae]